MVKKKQHLCLSLPPNKIHLYSLTTEKILQTIRLIITKPVFPLTGRLTMSTEPSAPPAKQHPQHSTRLMAHNKLSVQAAWSTDLSLSVHFFGLFLLVFFFQIPTHQCKA